MLFRPKVRQIDGETVTSKRFQVSWKRGKVVTFTCGACGQEAVKVACNPLQDFAGVAFPSGTCSNPDCRRVNLFQDIYGNTVRWSQRVGATETPYYSPLTGRVAPRPVALTEEAALAEGAIAPEVVAEAAARREAELEENLEALKPEALAPAAPEDDAPTEGPLEDVKVLEEALSPEDGLLQEEEEEAPQEPSSIYVSSLERTFPDPQPEKVSDDLPPQDRPTETMVITPEALAAEGERWRAAREAAGKDA